MVIVDHLVHHCSHVIESIDVGLGIRDGLNAVNVDQRTGDRGVGSTILMYCVLMMSKVIHHLRTLERHPIEVER